MRRKEEKKEAILNEDDDEEEEDEEDTDDTEDTEEESQHQQQQKSKPKTKAQKKKEAEREKWLDKFSAKQEKRSVESVAGISKGRIKRKEEIKRLNQEKEHESGISFALRQLSLQKKQKQQKKKKKQQQQEEEEATESGNEDYEEVEEQEEESINSQAEGEEKEQDGEDTAAAEEEESSNIVYESLEEEVKAYRDRYNISLSTSLSTSSSEQDEQLLSDPLYFPIQSFHDLKEQYSISSQLFDSFSLSTFPKPTPIQAQVWPCVLNGKDVIGLAVTGSGKTMAFLLGAFVLTYAQKQKKNQTQNMSESFQSGGPALPLVCILSPTRELALQTFTVANGIAEKFNNRLSTSSSSMFIRVVSLVGGPSIEGQRDLLLSSTSDPSSSIDMIICTTGRLLQLLQLSSSPSSPSVSSSSPPCISLSNVSYLVLDEADRMLDLGFQSELQSILTFITKNHQTLLCSATWPPSVANIATQLMRPNKYIMVQVGIDEMNVPNTVKQIVEIVDRRSGKREKRLLEILKEYPPSSQLLVLIFALYKREAQDLADYLTKRGYPATALHSDKSQAQRASTLASFRAGKIPILVATDVAARGLDVKNITLVVNFSIGLSIEHYIHRVGRCGRAGRSGTAISFFVDYNSNVAPELLALLQKSSTEAPPELKEYAERAVAKRAKHSDEQGLTGDALFALRKKKRQEQQGEEEDPLDKILGNEPGIKYVGGKGKKPHQGMKQRGRSRRGRN